MNIEDEPLLDPEPTRVVALPEKPTLRDHFAMAALSGLLASDDGAAWWKHAANAYELADAMLAARKKGADAE